MGPARGDSVSYGDDTAGENAVSRGGTRAAETGTDADGDGSSVGEGVRQHRRLPRSARRKQLMAAAQEVFVANGYHAAAMDDIAERAGVSKPVLYQHFPGKLELYLALLDMHTTDLVKAVRGAMAATSDNAQRVRNAVSAYFDFVDGESADVQGAFRLVFETDLRNEPAVRDRIADVSRRCMQAVADTIAADTGLPQAQVQLLSVAVTGTSEVAARWWLESDRALPKAEAVRLVEGLVWRGISHLPLAANQLDSRPAGSFEILAKEMFIDAFPDISPTDLAAEAAEISKAVLAARTSRS